MYVVKRDTHSHSFFKTPNTHTHTQVQAHCLFSFLTSDVCNTTPTEHMYAMYKCEFNAEQNDWLQLGLIISWVTGNHELDNYYDPERQRPPKKHASYRLFCSLMGVILIVSTVILLTTYFPFLWQEIDHTLWEK